MTPGGRARGREWAYRLGEWTAGSACASLLCFFVGPVWVLVWFLLMLLLTASLPLRVKRSRFLDLGRWTFGVWRNFNGSGLIVGLAFVRRDVGPDARPCGLELIAGKVTVGFFPLYTRTEYADLKAGRERQQP